MGYSMQFKEVGGQIQVIVYKGYDKEKKRSVTKMVGSLSRSNYSPSDGLLDSLSVDEKTELQSFIEKSLLSVKKHDRLLYAKFADSHINKLTDIFSDESVIIDDLQADKLWSAMADLQKVLKKRGYKKPKPVRQKKVSDSKQANLPI